MTILEETTDRVLNPRKIAIQVVGFLIGLALLIWCIIMATRGDGWAKLQTAPPAPLIGLVVFTLVSFAVNGAMFWVVIRPVRHVPLSDMVLLNLVTTVLNFAPIRFGLVARIAYNRRVDRLTFIQIMAWFAALTTMLVLSLVAGVIVTFLYPTIDVWWLLASLALAAVFFLGLRYLMGVPAIVSRAGGMEQMLRAPGPFWGGYVFRVIDIGAFVGRMACAAAILDLSLTAADTVLLGMAALFFSLNPLGRIGLREAVVTFLASAMVSEGMGIDTLEADMAALALIDSAGEALVAIPLGSLSLIWYRRKWVGSKE